MIETGFGLKPGPHWPARLLRGMLPPAMDKTFEKAGDGDSVRRQNHGRRQPKKATPEYLQRAALFYLERYASSAENLRRVLLRKVARSSRFHGTNADAGAKAVEELIERFIRSGLLNDLDYAGIRARSLLRRGQSLRAIRMHLAQKGLAASDIDAAIDSLRDEVASPELSAALAYIRRRRIGPYRPAEERNDRRERDLAALARRGFAPDLVLKVIDSEDLSELEREAASGETER